jgi:hypothetical protein
MLDRSILTAQLIDLTELLKDSSERCGLSVSLSKAKSVSDERIVGAREKNVAA